MENQRPIKIYLCLMLLIHSAGILSGFGASDHNSSSFPNEVGRRNLNVDYKSNQNASSLPYSRRYLMESFFENHDSLLDADSQDFLAHEPSLGFCEVLPLNHSSILTMSILQRHLIGQGSHRHLISSIKINIQPGAISELPSHSCKAIIIERLPSGVFADPFELKHLVERGVFLDAAIFGDTNLELPSALSNQSVVEVHMSIGHNILSTHQEGTEVKIGLPLHARYPPLDGSGGYSTIQMDLPDLLINCSVEESLQHQNCLWKSVSEGSEFRTGIVWKIPSGNSEHAKFVSAITFISALLSTLLIVVTSIFSSLIVKSKNFKHS
ncbi:phosphatidylinositol-glycan biosynthesis class X protein [Macadamia integrifolia]|uniref:phosphatidylinositol-glycan biosynthesis class X protein n=1 Tax=Macadamia integrifolia TaxID=60698 RepID=UPI001C500356|nr:phosphatidylinositol-glycan biosynthesis class X protein [Macadamia integrifolia]XP_042506114.1 phosphatidylinositol-glycan biosynthesis class X protein [Macadamia integrifolia]